MGVDLKNKRFCDECGRSMQKAHRIYQEKEYCGSCYPKIFIRKDCHICSNSTRVHKYSLEEPICRSCVTKTRTCQRCGKSVPKAGMIIHNRPVCPSCRPYFLSPRPCTSCNKETVHLSTVPHLGINSPICNSCRTKITHKTCHTCRKYRAVAGFTDNEKPYCSSCVPGAEQTHPCPNCTATVAGRGKSRCRSCINKQQIVQEVKLQIITLSHTWARDLLSQFGDWIHSRKAQDPNCFKTFVSHEPFFERLDSVYVDISEITPSTLVDKMGVAFLRKHLLATKFLKETLSVEADSSAKHSKAEQQCIARKLANTGNEPWGELLHEYSTLLQQDNLSIRTQRLYISTAEKFCRSAKISNKKAWNTIDIKNFLKQNPGSRANLFKFVSYCQTHKGWNVAMPTKTQKAAPKPSEHRTVQKFRKLLSEIKAKGIHNVEISLLEKTLATAFGYRLKAFQSFRWIIEHQEKQMFLLNGTDRILVPESLVTLANTWFYH